MGNNLIVDTCDFCAELHGIDCDNNILYRIIQPQTGLQSRVMFENQNFIVMPTLGAFVEGYVMAVSKSHYSCSLHLPEPMLCELETLLTKIRRSIMDTYHTPSVCFEHGSVSCSNRFGGCIDHAHIHVVPCDTPLIGQVEKYDLKIEKIESLSDIKQKSAEAPYLFLQDIDEQRYYITGSFIISQFFRQLLAQHYQVGGQWNWRRDLFLGNMKKTLEKMSVRA